MQAPLQAGNDSGAVQTEAAGTARQECGFVDERPAALAQGEMTGVLNSSPRMLYQRARSEAIDNSPRMVAQREEKPNSTGLPDRLKSGIESLSGMRMDHVRVHYNSDKPAQLQAHAYAQGNEIHLGAGQERHLPHEAWHVVQQAQGRVRPTFQMKAGTVNDDPSLEKEADIMGEKATQFAGAHDAWKLLSPIQRAPVVQRMSDFSMVVLKEILEHLVRAGLPGMLDLFLMMLSNYETIDDSEDERWELAEGFIEAFFLETPGTLLVPAINCMQALREVLATIEDADAVSALDKQLQTCIDILPSRLAESELETLAAAREYVTSEKETLGERGDADDPSYRDVLAASASKVVLEPSSGAHYLDGRAEPVRPLSHVDQKEGSKYHRSAKHSLYERFDKKKLPAMVVKSTKGYSTGMGDEAHSGLYPNALTFERNKADLADKNHKAWRKPRALSDSVATTPGDGAVYDGALEYKLSLCQKVADLCRGLTWLRVAVFNNYPLVMVRFDLAAFMAQYGKGKAAQTDALDKAFTSFLMNYYTGIANFFAQDAGLSITMVERSSFGFNTPSIAVTGQSFRINMGLMPPAYAYVHARALRKLNSQMAEIMKSKLPGNVDPTLAASSYLSDDKKEKLGKVDDLLALAVFPIESRNGSMIANAVRTRTALDYVNAQSFNFMAKYQGKRNGLGPVLSGLFGYTSVKKAGDKPTLSTKVDESKTHYEQLVPPTTAYPADPALEVQHETVLATMRLRLMELAHESDNEDFKDHLLGLLPLLRSSQPNLEVTMDLINELLLIHAIHQVDSEGADLHDDYGSASEVEEDDPASGPHIAVSKKRLLAGKKVITHNGMRALLAAVDSASKVVLANESELAMHVKAAYYETGAALKVSPGNAKVVKGNQPAQILLTDLNACVTGADEVLVSGILTGSKARVWIIDTTSATQARMNALIEQFRVSRASTLFLVSSGFKQEQMGADKNQYGTIRTFTDKDKAGRKRLDEVTARIKSTDKPLAASAHLYRRIMKKLGAVPTNSAILAGSKKSVSSSVGEDDFDWSQFDFSDSEDSKDDLARNERFDAFLKALTEVEDQMDDDVGAGLADTSHHASEFVHAQESGAPKVGASKAWFTVIPNKGGGDCLFHALNGRNLDFGEIVALRDRLAVAAGETATVDLSGSGIYQTLYQSGQMTRAIHDLMQTRHRVPRSVFQAMIRVPGMYAGDAELQAYCAIQGNPQAVYVVTIAGELRRVSVGPTVTVARCAVGGDAAFKQQVQELLNNGQTVLYQSNNHWEQITATR